MLADSTQLGQPLLLFESKTKVMPIVGDRRFSRILPLAVFERLQELLQQMRTKIGDNAVVLTADMLPNSTKALKEQAQQFTALISEPFSALVLGEPQPELSGVDDVKLTPYKVGLTFEPNAIASFLRDLAGGLENYPLVVDLLNKAQACLQPNDAALQTEFTLSLIEILSTGSINDFVSARPIHAQVSACQPFVEKALRQQVEQERLLHQVTTHIRQSLELPVILETTVKQVRYFLQVDRLLIYQFDDFQCAIRKQNISSTTENAEPSTLLTIPHFSQLASEESLGCVTYEARASNAIASVLNLVEGEDCSIHVPNSRKKYHQGIAIAIDDVETAYTTSAYLLELLRKTQVRAKLVAPIIVQNDLWGLLIAHQCFEPRQWKDTEKTFLKQIAEHLTVAIYQAQLYAQLQQQKHTLEQRVIEQTQELRDMLQAAQAASRAKSEFLAAMSHELRTPLTCVIGMSATLLRWSFGQQGAKAVPLAKQRRYLKTIQDSGEHLLELINDILDLSQVEAGKAILNISEFSLSQLTHQILRTLQEKAFRQKISLEMEFQVPSQSDSGARLKEDRFYADQRRVRQILFNLLGNAIKFTPAGGKVILRVWREHNLAVFQIEDTGIGIADDQIPLLFEKFQQLETTYHRNYEGTGLGLALTKQLVELHGGRIEVESVVGEGSLFTVWLPSQPLFKSTSSKAIATQKDRPEPQGTIVLVEDQEESAVPICEILTAAGYQIVWLIDGSTAVEQIELLQPKAVICGWYLTGIDSSEMIYNLRNSAATQQIKVLALINPPLSEDQEQDLHMGVDAYLHKPVEPMQLVHQVTALMAT